MCAVFRLDLDVTIGASIFLPLHRVTYRQRFEFGGLLGRLFPQMNAHIGRLQRALRHGLRIVDELAIALDERLVGIGVDRLEIRERAETSAAYSAPIAAISISRSPRRRSDLVLAEALVLELAVEGDD